MVEDAKELLDLIHKYEVYSFDIEHELGFDFNMPGFTLWGCSFAVGDRAWFIRDKETVSGILNEIFPNPELEAVAYNGKYDLKCLRASGWCDEYPAKLCDPMVAINLLDENRRPNQLSLKSVIRDRYAYEMMDIKVAAAGGPDTVLFHNYTKDDARYELRLWRDVKREMASEGLTKLFTSILMPVCKVFADMELHGIYWDTAQARKLLFGFAALRQECEEEIFTTIGTLNLNSGNQLANRLFNDLGYDTTGIKLTTKKTRLSTDAEAMETLAKKYPVCKKIVTYRTAEKMIGTYVEPQTRRALDDPRGRVHPTVWVVSATGRTRMEKPNFQNQPMYLADEFKGLSIRSCVKAPEGRKLAVFDLSQIELRMCAHIAHEPLFLKAFREWRCVTCGAKGEENHELFHRCPTCGAPENEGILRHLAKDEKEQGFWHGLDLHTMTYESIEVLKDRQAGKTANFALIFNATAVRMNAEYPKLSIGEWDDVIDGFMEKYRGVKAWHLRMEHGLKTNPICTDVFGRKRRILKRDIYASFKHALNMFINFPVQSSACGYILLCMVKIREELSEMGLWEKVIWIVNFVHDEIIFEVEEASLEIVVPIITRIMESAVRFDVPIRTECEIADSWDKAK